MPKLFVVSACLAGQPCRYDGKAYPCEAVIALVDNGLALPLCPEQLAGLGAPRTPFELRAGKAWTRDGQDWTAALHNGSALALHQAQEAGCRVAILKARSPSCGVDRIYDGSFSKRLIPGEGVWAGALRQAGFRLFTEEQIADVRAPHLPLHTERLLLRQWRLEDLPLFAALNADPEVMAHFPATLRPDESDAFAERIRGLIAEHGWGFWAVERKADGAFLGFVGLHQPDDLPFAPCTELGWRLARPFWGQGYATEAARACRDFAFEALGIEELVAFTAVGNARSQAVMRRLGMVEDGLFEHPALPAGHRLRTHVLYRLQRHSQASNAL